MANNPEIFTGEWPVDTPIYWVEQGVARMARSTGEELVQHQLAVRKLDRLRAAKTAKVSAVEYLPTATTSRPPRPGGER